MDIRDPINTLECCGRSEAYARVSSHYLSRLMFKLGMLVQGNSWASGPEHLNQDVGIVVELDDGKYEPQAVKVLWGTGIISIEWADELKLISEKNKDR